MLDARREGRAEGRADGQVLELASDRLHIPLPDFLEDMQSKLPSFYTKGYSKLLFLVLLFHKTQCLSAFSATLLTQ